MFSEQTAPQSYNPLTQKPECKLSVTTQASCGSCYSFGTINSLRRRLCTVHDQYDIRLSEANALECSAYSTKPCKGGGNLFNELNAMGGAVSERCEPYQLVKGGKFDWQFCYEGKCPQTCVDGSQKQQWKVGKTKYLGKAPKDIYEEIYTNGSVAVAFPVYFDSFKPGHIWQKGTKQDGGHMVECYGQGSEGGVDFLQCMNSWGPTWNTDG